VGAQVIGIELDAAARYAAATRQRAAFCVGLGGVALPAYPTSKRRRHEHHARAVVRQG
jgi:hypothetical protein